MTPAEEKDLIAKIAAAARKFLESYDEFEGDPSCVGEWLDALFDACNEYGD